MNASGGDRCTAEGVVMSFMWTIVLVSLLAVVVAAIGVAGLAGVVRMLRRPSPRAAGRHRSGRGGR